MVRGRWRKDEEEGDKREVEERKKRWKEWR